MKNSKSGKAKVAVIIVIAVIAAAAAGIIIYRNNVIKEAKNEAIAVIDSFDTSLYDGDELKTVEGYVADAKAKLEACKDKEGFQPIVEEFNKNVAEVKTTAQKEEEARIEAEKKAREEAAARKSSKKKGKDSGGCVGGGSKNFY